MSPVNRTKCSGISIFFSRTLGQERLKKDLTEHFKKKTDALGCAGSRSLDHRTARTLSVKNDNLKLISYNFGKTLSAISPQISNTLEFYTVFERKKSVGNNIKKLLGVQRTFASIFLEKYKTCPFVSKVERYSFGRVIKENVFRSQGNILKKLKKKYFVFEFLF